MNKGKIGLLLVNLGTPDSPSVRDVTKYLIEFLSDPRVLDIPWWKRQLLVRGVIVPSRRKQSAQAYQLIWTDKGSPLKVYGGIVKERLQDVLGRDFQVEFAMRYRVPSLSEAIERFNQSHLKRIFVVPLFPQYASATTGSVHQKIMEIVCKWPVIPEMTFINSFANDEGLIQAFCAVSQDFELKSYDHILFSFHGLPKRQLQKIEGASQVCFKTAECCVNSYKENPNCYSAQCYSMSNALAHALQLEKGCYTICFQSRLGKEPWLEPFTNEVIHQLASQGKKKILVFCPSFVCDCLETLYEIGIEYAREFKRAGGKVLDLVPGLNDHPVWINALAKMIKQHL